MESNESKGKVKLLQCCEEAVKAQESGTDNEGYGKLLRDVFQDGDWRIGDVGLLPPIKFCPWCGKPAT